MIETVLLYVVGTLVLFVLLGWLISLQKNYKVTITSATITGKPLVWKAKQ